MIRDVLDAVIGADDRPDHDGDPADRLDADAEEQVEELIGAVRHEARRQQRGGRR